MRSYLAMELIAALWLMGAILARSENLDRIWVFCCTMAAFYYLRAIVKYFIGKEKAHEKDYFIAGPGGRAIRVRHRYPYSDSKDASPGNFNG